MFLFFFIICARNGGEWALVVDGRDRILEPAWFFRDACFFLVFGDDEEEEDRWQQCVAGRRGRGSCAAATTFGEGE